VQNVTTYGTIINVPNQDLRLKPGMTANLRVQIARRPDALRIANAALRFRPTNEMFAALNEPVPPEMLGGGRGGRGRRNADGANASVTPAGVPAGAQANAAKPAGASPAPPAAPAQAGEPRVQRNFGAGGGGDFGGRG